MWCVLCVCVFVEQDVRMLLLEMGGKVGGWAVGGVRVMAKVGALLCNIC